MINSYMITDFIRATNIHQVSDDLNQTIPWNNTEASVLTESYAISDKPLYTISGLWMERFRSKTNQIWTTNYQIPILSSIISGIELRINIKRSSRIQDLVIQLTLNDMLIGLNYAVDMTTQYAYQHNIPLIEDYHIYGNSSDLWGTELTIEDLQNPTFGAVVSYQSNETLPHKDLVYINQIALRVHFG